MLKRLRVKNFAIIDELELEFGDGLNVLTGETGAGKSIITGALGIVTGQRAYTEMIKSGTDEATVEASFDITDNPVLEAMGIDSPDGIILRRVVSRAGKTRAYINGSMVTLQNLAALGGTLLDIHGQNEHHGLLVAGTQLSLLDGYGGLAPERGSVGKLYGQTQKIRRRLEHIRQGARAAAQKLDMLRFQINELEEAALETGEEEKLKEERAILGNLTRLTELSSGAYASLYGDEGSAVERLTSASVNLTEMSGIDHSVSEPLEALRQALAQAEDASHLLRGFIDRYEADPARLEAVEDRLALISDLRRKYGDSVEQVMEFLDNARQELEDIETSDESAEELEQELIESEANLAKAASILSARRQKAAQKLGKAVQEVLKDLALKKSRFEVELKTVAITSAGAEIPEFMFSANSGEDIKSLARVASGGELSRVMLAIKSVLREADDIPVLVFDEVDAGIGGKTAQNVAQKLKDTSAGRQVLCITHLPQIASFADTHILIEKAPGKNSVSVSIKTLEGKQRQEEIARMLSGSITETSLEHAREILQASRTLSSAS